MEEASGAPTAPEPTPEPASPKLRVAATAPDGAAPAPDGGAVGPGGGDWIDDVRAPAFLPDHN